MTYEKHFRLSVVLKFEASEPLTDLQVDAVQKLLQRYVDYARDKFAEIPEGVAPNDVVVEPASQKPSVSERVDEILAILKGASQ
jgi:hypothetical protein